MSTKNRQPVDATSARLFELRDRVLGGEQLTREAAAGLFQLRAAADVCDLLACANRIRERFKGNQVHLCSIINAKAGGCSEDCRFCAQSAFYQTAAPRHGFIDPEPMLAAAEEAHRNGVRGLGLVAAWKGLEEGPLLDEVCERFRQLTQTGKVRPDASLGIINSQTVADRLQAAGVQCYNHNLETSPRFFAHQCSTHAYEDRLQTLRYLKRAGIRVCSGGIIGLGESWEDRLELALALREAGADIVPINILNPIAGTPYEHNAPVPPLEILQTIACFRFVLPGQEIMIAGGRTVNLRDAQSLIFMAGANALMVGNYLTTLNQPVEKDLQMIKDLGLTVCAGG